MYSCQLYSSLFKKGRMTIIVACWWLNIHLSGISNLIKNRRMTIMYVDKLKLAFVSNSRKSSIYFRCDLYVSNINISFYVSLDVILVYTIVYYIYMHRTLFWCPSMDLTQSLSLRPFTFTISGKGKVNIDNLSV